MTRVPTLFVLFFFFFLFFFLFSPPPVSAAFFSVESLFRNGSNPDIDRESSVVDLVVEELVDENQGEEISLSSRSPLKRRYRFIFNRNNDDNGKLKDVELLQVEYDSLGKKERGGVIGLFESRTLFRYFRRKKNIQPERDIFWGLMGSLVLNKSNIMSSFLKKTDRGYRENKRIINRSRVRLYSNYKKYLHTIRDEPSLKNSLSSPLEPSTEKGRETVRKILSSPFYLPSGKFSLVRELEQFYVLLKLDKTQAKFTNGDMKLLNLKYGDSAGGIEVKLFDYVKQSNGYHFPKNIFFDAMGKKYRIQIFSIKHLNYGEKGLNKMKKSLRDTFEARKAERSNKEKFPVTSPPVFLFF